MATCETERGKGYGSAILRELCKMVMSSGSWVKRWHVNHRQQAVEQDKIVALNAIRNCNVCNIFA